MRRRRCGTSRPGEFLAAFLDDDGTTLLVLAIIEAVRRAVAAVVCGICCCRCWISAHQLLWRADRLPVGSDPGCRQLLDGRRAAVAAAAADRRRCYYRRCRPRYLLGPDAPVACRSLNVAKAQNHLPRRSATQVANQQKIVTRALKQLSDDVPRLPWTKLTKDALILRQAYAINFRAGGTRYLLQSLLQAGIHSMDAKAAGIPHNLSGGGPIIRWPFGLGRCWNRSSRVGRWFRMALSASYCMPDLRCRGRRCRLIAPEAEARLPPVPTV